MPTPPDQPVPPRCGNCGLGVEIRIPGEIKSRIQCRMGVAVAVPITHPKTGEVGAKFMRPIWDAEDWCYSFVPKAPANA